MRPLTPSTQHPCDVQPVGNPEGAAALEVTEVAEVAEVADDTVDAAFTDEVVGLVEVLLTA